MKSMKKLIAVLLVAVMGIGVADAGLRFGVKLGTNVNHLSSSLAGTLDKNNRAGFTGGIMSEYMTPLLGLGFDLGVQYAYMNTPTEITFNNNSQELSKNKNFIQIPLNIKYKISLPVVGSFLSPYVFTGPSFDFKLDKNIVNDVKTKTFQTVWNIGLGLEFVKHLQIGASYGFGLNKVAEWSIPDYTPANYHNNYWTITAAYLF